MSEPVEFLPDNIIAALRKRGVEYIVIGAFGAILHGSPYPTADIDICPNLEHSNLERLASALVDLDARIYAVDEPEGVTFDRSAEMLERAQVWSLITTAGRLDICFEPAGTSGYADLVRDAVVISLRGADIVVASLADIIRSKDAAGRDKDRVQLQTLRRLLDRINRGESP